MKVSIVVPSYNQSKFVEETIASLISESSEVIVYDGDSIDGTQKILEKYDEKIFFWKSETDGGQSDAINKGLRKITGEIINWINSDDYLEKGALECIEKAFYNSDVNVYIGKSNIVQDGKILRQSRGTDVFPKNLAKTIGQARIDQPETWWRKSIIDEIGPLNENLHYTMDRDWWVKYLLRYGLNGIKKEDVILANFRLHGASKTVSQSSAFNHERNAYYRSMAEHYGLKGIAKILEKELDAGIIPMTNMPQRVNMDTLLKSYSYFLLLLADEAYVQGNHKKVKSILHSLDISHLSEEDAIFADKLKSRSHLPKSLIRIARKLKK
jgi:glycosyltransferase involved in cell wall biosynthesis